jgi:hypothetical protein
MRGEKQEEREGIPRAKARLSILLSPFYFIVDRLLPDWSDRYQFAVILGYFGYGGLPIGLMAVFAAWERGWLSLGGVMVAVVGLIVGLFLLALSLWSLISAVSRAFVGTLLAQGNLKPRESTSAEESMVLRGRADDAIASYQRRIRESPGTVTLRLELSRLFQSRGELEEAALLLNEIRVISPRGEHETLVGNSLIDLYERLGDRGRLAAEYARFAASHKGTRAGEAAKRRLAELKAEIGDPRAG